MILSICEVTGLFVLLSVLGLLLNGMVAATAGQLCKYWHGVEKVVVIMAVDFLYGLKKTKKLLEQQCVMLCLLVLHGTSSVVTSRVGGDITACCFLAPCLLAGYMNISVHVDFFLPPGF